MDWSFHIPYILLMLLLLFVAYGAFFKDWGRKHYELTRRIPFFSMFMPHELRDYVIIYKVLIITPLLIIISFYIFLIIRSG